MLCNIIGSHASAPQDASAYETPVTYQRRTGKQHVVVVAGGGSFWVSYTSDVILAFALP